MPIARVVQMSGKFSGQVSRFWMIGVVALEIHRLPVISSQHRYDDWVSLFRRGPSAVDEVAAGGYHAVVIGVFSCR